MNLYHDLILDHYKHPRNFGELENPDAIGRESNATCGDLIEMQLQESRVKSRVKKIADIKWRGIGCAISTASASLLSEKIKNMPLSEIQKITDQNVVELLGGEITSVRIKCATLPLKALQNTINKLK